MNRIYHFYFGLRKAKKTLGLLKVSYLIYPSKSILVIISTILRFLSNAYIYYLSYLQSQSQYIYTSKLHNMFSITLFFLQYCYRLFILRSCAHLPFPSSSSTFFFSLSIISAVHYSLLHLTSQFILYCIPTYFYFFFFFNLFLVLLHTSMQC